MTLQTPQWEELDYRMARKGMYPFDGQDVLVTVGAGIRELSWTAAHYRLEAGFSPAPSFKNASGIDSSFSWMDKDLTLFEANRGLWMPSPGRTTLRMLNQAELLEFAARRISGSPPNTEAPMIFLGGRGWLQAELSPEQDAWLLSDGETVSTWAFFSGVIVPLPDPLQEISALAPTMEVHPWA